MRAIFMGTPSFVIPVLESLISLNADVVGVFTQPDRAAGRGMLTGATPVKEFAEDKGLPVFQPASLRREEARQKLTDLRPDVMLVAGYGRILPPEVLGIPPRGCVNVHPSLLPRYRGPSPVAGAILAGDEVTGVTIMLMDQEMDTGPVLAYREAPIDPADTAGSLNPRLFLLGAELLRDVLPRWMDGLVSPRPQDEALATVTPKLEKGDGDVHWGEPAVQLGRRLRAYTPWPGLFTHWKGKLVKILDAVPVDVHYGTQGEPGQVLELDMPQTPVGVATGRGILGLRSLQMEGKRPLAAGEFIRGYRDFLGSRLPG